MCQEAPLVGFECVERVDVGGKAFDIAAHDAGIIKSQTPQDLSGCLRGSI
jgi:hypothetical protein